MVPLEQVTPQLPLPSWKAKPNEPGCKDEGAIVCANGRWVTCARALVCVCVTVCARARVCTTPVCAAGSGIG